MTIINGMYILDYPDRLTEKKITEEGQRVLREATEIMKEFMKENPITLVNSEGKKIL